MVALQSLWTALTAVFFLNDSAAQHKRDFDFTCDPSWPSESKELCPFEGDEYKPSHVSRLFRKELMKVTTVTLTDTDLEDDASDLNTTVFDPLVNTRATEAEDNNSDNSTSLAPPVSANGPKWPNKWTTIPCCQITCACAKYFEAMKSIRPKPESKDWKKGRCCWQKMADDPNCSNPPPITRWDWVEPPWCVV